MRGKVRRIFRSVDALDSNPRLRASRVVPEMPGNRASIGREDSRLEAARFYALADQSIRNLFDCLLLLTKFLKVYKDAFPYACGRTMLVGLHTRPCRCSRATVNTRCVDDVLEITTQSTFIHDVYAHVLI
jgi:hypothetical protein